MRLIPAVHIGKFDRVALIADVHGNVAALHAVLEAIGAAEVDAICSLGCLTWGPYPCEMLTALAATPVPSFFLRGNGERAALELAAGERATTHAVDDWMVRAHGPQGIATLQRQPRALTLEIRGGAQARLCHGSPRSDIELLTPGTPDDRIEAACDGAVEPIIVHGHTHIQYQRSVGDRVIVGCGSVGLPYHDGPPAALWTVLDASGAHPRQTPYDVAAAADAIAESGYPASERYVQTMRQPPSVASIVEDAKTRHFSD